MKDSSGRFIFWIVPACLALVACESIPESDFYEAEGIVSVYATSLDMFEGWQSASLPLTTSLVSRNLPGTLRFTFYVRQPGEYGVWLMVSRKPDAEIITAGIRISDTDQFLLDRYQIKPEEGLVPRWISSDLSGEQLIADFQSPGFYTVTIETGGQAGIILHKLHLTRGNLHKPEGMGFPETRTPGADPLLEKREHIVRIPPAWSFGFLTDYEPRFPADACKTGADDCRSYYDRRFDMFSDMESLDQLGENHNASSSEDKRGFLFSNIPTLDDPQFKIYPALFFIEEDQKSAPLNSQIRWLSDPDHPLYEVPYLALIENHKIEDLFRWLQLQAFSNFMFVPSGQIAEALAGSDEEKLFAELVSEYADFRRKLFPYIYSYTLRSRTRGVKLITGIRGYPDQYQFGEAFLVAPVVLKGATSRTVRFPEGIWYDYYTRETYEGGRTWIVEVNENRIPLFVKAGSIIPFRPEAVPIEAGNNEMLILDIYTGDAGTFRLYEDDGISTDYRRGEFSTVAFRWFEHEDYATFNIGAMVRGFEGQTDTRKYKMRFLFAERPVSVTANGDSVEEGRGEGRWYYSEEENALVINWEQEQRRRTEFVIRFR